MTSDLEFSLHLADLAAAETMRFWSPAGVPARPKPDGTPVTEADVAAERTMLATVRRNRPNDAFVGEEVGAHDGASGRRWIVDGIDGTRFFVAGARTWGTLIALEVDRVIVLGISSSPAQDRRWWASRGEGTFVGLADLSRAKPLGVSDRVDLAPDRVACLPGFAALSPARRDILVDLTGSELRDHHWSHQNRVADGELDLCVWFGGDVWDHAAPSILVEEAGGRFSDHVGGNRLDTRRAVYSNGRIHDRVLDRLAEET